MQSFIVAIRSIGWGLALLCCFLLLAFSFFGGFYKFERYRSASYTREAQIANSAIADDVKRLDEIEKNRTWNQETNTFVISSAAKAEADMLQKRIESRAKQVCSYSCVGTYEISYSIYPTIDGSNQNEYARRISSQLEILGDPDHNRDYNIFNAVSHVSLIILAMLTAYLMITLFKFRTLGWKKILFNIAIISPFLAIFTVTGLMRQEGEYDTIKDTGFWIIPVSIFYLFVVYPPSISLLRRAQIKPFDSLRIWLNNKG